jgi:hypothetical protein
VLACHQIQWQDAVAICGRFTTPARFLFISKRVRLLDRVVLAAMGGLVAANSAEVDANLTRLVRTGYNVILASDDLLEPGSELSRLLLTDSARRHFVVLPVAIVQLDKVTDRHSKAFKCGVPFSRSRPISSKKLAGEMQRLRAETAIDAGPDELRGEGEQHVG